MAAPVLRSTNEYNSSSSGSGVVNLPTGTVDGDLQFFVSSHRVSYSTASPSGLTLLAQGNGGANLGWFELWVRVASSEPSTYTWTYATNERVRILALTYIGGFFDTTTPVDVVSNTGYGTNNTTARAGSMTVTNANSALFFFANVFRTSAVTVTPPTVPTTFTDDYDGGSTNPDMWNEVASCQWSGSGATGNMDGTISVSIASKAMFAVAINPATGGSTVNSGFFALM